jgi:hypothetical protein
MFNRLTKKPYMGFLIFINLSGVHVFVATVRACFNVRCLHRRPQFAAYFRHTARHVRQIVNALDLGHLHKLEPQNEKKPVRLFWSERKVSARSRT